MTALDTGTEDLRAEIDGGVAVITMNRPDRRNAFSHAVVSALGAVLAQVETDEAVGCVVLTGAGGAFCAGGDVKSMAAPPTDRGDGSGRSLDALIHRQRLNQRATSGRLWNMPKPTIAAIGGPAAGHGAAIGVYKDVGTAEACAPYGMPGIGVAVTRPGPGLAVPDRGCCHFDYSCIANTLSDAALICNHRPGAPCRLRAGG
jgi:2-(1,2-epoxy-1,2-dihydrophenyl)acetyl-CoA isomerase